MGPPPCASCHEGRVSESTDMFPARRAHTLPHPTKRKIRRDEAPDLMAVRIAKPSSTVQSTSPIRLIHGYFNDIPRSDMPLQKAEEPLKLTWTREPIDRFPFNNAHGCLLEWSNPENPASLYFWNEQLHSTTHQAALCGSVPLVHQCTYGHFGSD